MRNSLPVIDLHCDLLSYLCSDPSHTPLDPAARCSFPQLLQGNVKLQTLAIFTETNPHSVAEGKKQIDQFIHLMTHSSHGFTPFSFPLEADTPTVQCIASFENGSGFADEREPLSAAFQRLEQYTSLLRPILYISLTWNGENRFGGGTGSEKGLKPDGKELLAWMNGRNIALDFSHASDPLAEEMLECIDTHGYNIPLLASHSNFREVTDAPRNLPPFLAKEIIQRKGVIGLNFFSPFVHRKDRSVLWRHVEYGFSIGAENALCLGADFFCAADFPKLIAKYHTNQPFFPEYSDASCYPRFFEELKQNLKISEEQMLKISCRNALRFIKELTL